MAARSIDLSTSSRRRHFLVLASHSPSVIWSWADDLRVTLRVTLTRGGIVTDAHGRRITTKTYIAGVDAGDTPPNSRLPWVLLVVSTTAGARGRAAFCAARVRG